MASSYRGNLPFVPSIGVNAHSLCVMKVPEHITDFNLFISLNNTELCWDGSHNVFILPPKNDSLELNE